MNATLREVVLGTDEELGGTGLPSLTLSLPALILPPTQGITCVPAASGNSSHFGCGVFVVGERVRAPPGVSCWSHSSPPLPTSTQQSRMS